MPSFLGFMGIGCVTIGGYFLHRQDYIQHQPKMGKNASLGSLLMLCVAALWSISSAYDKIGVANSSQLIYGATIQSVVAIGSVVALAIRTHRCEQCKKSPSLPEVNSNPTTKDHDGTSKPTTTIWKKLLLLSAAHSIISYYLHLLATAHANVSYVIALKRAGCILTVL